MAGAVAKATGRGYPTGAGVGSARGDAAGGDAPMIDDDLMALLDPVFASTGAVAEDGEEFRDPPLDVLKYGRRPVRLHWLPGLGRGWGVTAVVRQPVDLGLKVGGGYATLLDRLARAAHSRFPPGRDGRWGTIGLTAVVLTPEPIAPEDDAALGAALVPRTRARVVPLGLIRLNLGQEAMAMALTTTPPDLFPEPTALADALTPRFRRFVSLLEL